MRPPGAGRDVALELPEPDMGATPAIPERLRLPLCCLGVFACYCCYGILQESITRGRYGEGAHQEKFRFALTLVFIQCVINAAFAKLLIRLVDAARVDRTRGWLYGACSLSYLGAMVSSNSALQFVSYPTQVLGKSCKPIPVMLLGVTLLRKKYPPAKYLCVLLIVAGVALFLYKPKKGAGGDDHVFGYGELLLLLSLTLDGLTGVSQDHMRAHYQTGSNHMMLNVNLWSTLFLGAGILFTGELWEFLSFTERYPSVIYNILLFGLTSALGQVSAPALPPRILGWLWTTLCCSGGCLDPAQPVGWGGTGSSSAQTIPGLCETESSLRADNQNLR
ncbi:solute carrier family 35 member B1 [Empidonax traillii]|uniref:solute carrier family 35 member B1 n=1 Tax=Empidonax traillii TaxID=164674 RepID=UPI000FFCED5E|nr:solute carrier family 35 member B1 [Empidonax traillii]